MLGDVRQYSMRQPMQQPCFVRKSLAELLLSEVSLLHRNPAAKPQVLGKINAPHPAPFEQRQDAIAILQDSLSCEFARFHHYRLPSRFAHSPAWMKLAQ